MLIDEAKIIVQSGKGGDGAVAFNKNMMSLGPAGGSGGRGGSVYLEAVEDIGALRQFRAKKVFKAEDGANGKGQFCDGPDAADIVLKVPVGTAVENIDTKESYDLTEIGQKILVAEGGRGGRGNFHFRSSTNTTPRQFEYGYSGVRYSLSLTLKIIADVGLVGLPNAGKSTFLNLFTRANSKVANYPFTTLEPHLGAYYGLILADIPGLIEGASQGKGLGAKFLRHIERTRVLFHLVSAENEDVVAAYKTIRNELKAHSPQLTGKREYVFLTKRDVVPEKEFAEKLSALRKLNSECRALSMYDDGDCKEAEKVLNALEKQKAEGKLKLAEAPIKQAAEGSEEIYVHRLPERQAPRIGQVEVKPRMIRGKRVKGK